VTSAVSGQITRRVYIAGAAIVIGVQATPEITLPAETRYLLKDHLGSIDVVLDSNGGVLERMSFDAWGKRRKLDWTHYTGDPAVIGSSNGF
jgi:hypothetical protein